MSVRDLSTVLTTEMTQEEWGQHRADWIARYRRDLVVECGNDPDDPTLDDVAEISFEHYCGQEGWTGRDERLRAARERTP
jgi:hypothetical protein